MFKQGLFLSPNCNLISDSVVLVFFFHFIMYSNAVVHVTLFFWLDSVKYLPAMGD